MQKTLGALQNQLQLRAQIKALQEEIDNQPAEIKALETATPDDLEPSEPDLPEQLSDEALEQRLTYVNTRLLELERDMALQQQTKSQAEQRQQTIREQLTGLKLNLEVKESSDAGEFSELRQQMEIATFTERQLRVQALELELLVLPRRAEIAQLTWQQLETERNRQTTLQNRLTEYKQSRQRSEAEKTLLELDEDLNNTEVKPLLANAYNENQQLSSELRNLLNRIEKTDNKRLSLQQRLTTLSSTFRSIAQQLELEVSHISPEQRRFIFRNREPLDTRQTANAINLLRLESTLLEQKKTEAVSHRSQIPESLQASLNENEQQIYRDILDDRLRLINRLSDAKEQLIRVLNQILSIEKQLNQQIETNSELLTKQLLWNPVSNPINLQWPKQIFIGIGQVLEHWNQDQPEPLLKADDSTALRVIMLFFVVSFITWLSHYHRRERKRWCQYIGNVIHDRFHHSVQTMVLSVITALPLPLALWVASRSLINPAHPDAETWTALLFTTAFATWCIHSLRNWMKTPYGLFAAHFGISDTLVHALRQRLGVLYVICLPLLLVHIYLWNIDSDEIRSGLVRLVMFALITMIVLLWASLWRVKRELNQLTDSISWWSRAELWLSALVLFNVAMLAMTATGYTFTVNFMVYAVLQTLMVLLAAIVFYKLGLRLVLISERRLEFDRAKARRAEILAAREKSEEEPPLKTDYLDMRTVSDHSRTLLKTATVVALVAMLWGFLGGFLPFFGALDNVEVWNTISADGETIRQITLKSLLFGVVILGLSLLAAYNLPGLLELLILRNLDLTPGTGYAVSSLIKYVLIMVGVLGAFSSFGLEWSKLQWLVAALGVGLGFGLQEIVANFVSGLIILFEKPVRIGDTVTIDNLTGTVTKIQIRATTIVDWDRKEVIIPNKTFITQQLINWSLTDSITRIVIPVGLAYGSDTERARKLLLEAATEQDRVLKDPKPEAFFTAFGDSTLNLELRLFVNAMADRLEMTHKVNTKIAQKFKEAGLEIAFPQLDVHLHKVEKPGS
ncbi:mechanosensitive ion channel [Pontibacterium granulatum]|uniref:mechanosensitive ion channel domain-containing protein n=1 Tax=Pontibacterium granulatum TaxID=2036029 RepID=UPI002499ED8F|nr:mechanosensitive ion channel domain-containing protein [Pontibacterium granulatum]MDI3323276.1 mechanosensitive ion channel [Pontibacterium granulatum]